MLEGIENFLDKSYRCYEMAKLAYNKGFYDDSVSRYYYSAYFKMQYIVSKYGKDVIDVNNRSSHLNTFKEINNIANKKRDISNESKVDLLNYLAIKDFRKSADYGKEIIKKDKFDSAFMKRFSRFYKSLEEIIGKSG